MFSLIWAYAYVIIYYGYGIRFNITVSGPVWSGLKILKPKSDRKLIFSKKVGPDHLDHRPNQMLKLRFFLI